MLSSYWPLAGPLVPCLLGEVARAPECPPSSCKGSWTFSLGFSSKSSHHTLPTPPGQTPALPSVTPQGLWGGVGGSLGSPASAPASSWHPRALGSFLLSHASPVPEGRQGRGGEGEPIPRPRLRLRPVWGLRVPAGLLAGLGRAEPQQTTLRPAVGRLFVHTLDPEHVGERSPVDPGGWGCRPRAGEDSCHGPNPCLPSTSRPARCPGHLPRPPAGTPRPAPVAPLHPAQPPPPRLPLREPHPRRSRPPGHRGTGRAGGRGGHVRVPHGQASDWVIARSSLPSPTALASPPPLQVVAYNRDSFDTTQQSLVLLIGDPEGTTYPAPPTPVWGGESPREGVWGRKDLERSGGQGILGSLRACILGCTAGGQSVGLGKGVWGL